MVLSNVFMQLGWLDSWGGDNKNNNRRVGKVCLRELVEFV